MYLYWGFFFKEYVWVGPLGICLGLMLGFFLGLLCKIQTNLFGKIIRFYYYYFFLGGRGLKAIHLDLAGIRNFF